MNPRKPLIYIKKILNFCRSFSSKRVSDNIYILSLFGLISLLLQFGIADNLRTITGLLIVSTFILSLKIKNLLVSFFLMTIYSFQLFFPNKYNIVEVIKSYELSKISGYDGFVLGYGLNIPNLFILLTLILCFRTIILKRIFFKKEYLRKILLISLAAILFFSISATISYNISPFKELSLVWLLQYSQVFIVGFIFAFIYVTSKKQFIYIYPVLLISIIFQLFLSIRQFNHQALLGLNIEKPVSDSLYAIPPDVNDAVFRVSGSFLWHNQLALIMLIFSIPLIPYYLKKNNKYYLFIFLASFITIILTQSRSAWLAGGVILFLTYKNYKRYIVNFIQHIGQIRFLIFSSLIILILSYIILPRILLTLNSIYEGAGIPFRIQIIREGLEALELNPWIGYGVGTNEYTLYHLFPTGTMSEFPKPVHLGFLQFALEVGLFGFTLFLFPFVYILRLLIINSSKLFNQNGRDYRFIYITGSIAFFIDYLFLAHTAIIESVFLGIILGFGLISLLNLKQKSA